MFPDYVKKEENDKQLDWLFSQKIHTIKFSRQVADLGLVEAKNLQEWFVNFCPDHITGWEKISLFVTLAKQLAAGVLFINEDNTEAYRVRILTTEEVFSEFGLKIRSTSPTEITQRIEYKFPC